jgi:FemAB-related protein (PEP-CTERM system-associated)
MTDGLQNINVREISFGEKEEWDRYVLSHPESSCYHRFGWMRAVESVYGHPSHYLAARRAAREASGEEGRICGILPLVHMNHFLSGNVLVSLPFADLGGALADDGETENALLRAALALGRKLGAGKIELRCRREPVTGDMPEGGIIRHSRDKVLMVRSLPGDQEELFRDFKSQRRKHIRKAEKSGLTCRVGGGNFLDEFYRVFGEHMRDLGSPVHSREWFRKVMEEYEGWSIFGVIYLKETPVAAGILLHLESTATIPWSASLRKYQDYYPNTLLFWSFLKYACDTGILKFDFGRSTVGGGTYVFKEKWGAHPQPLHWYSLRTSPGAGNGKHPADVLGRADAGRDIAAWIWARLPLSLANYLGPRVRRNIPL